MSAPGQGDTADIPALEALEKLAARLFPMLVYIPAWERRQKAQGLLAELRGIGWDVCRVSELETLREIGEQHARAKRQGVAK